MDSSGPELALVRETMGSVWGWGMGEEAVGPAPNTTSSSVDPGAGDPEAVKGGTQPMKKPLRTHALGVFGGGEGSRAEM